MFPRQPFVVQETLPLNQPQQQQRQKTTAAFRRRQRRNHEQQYNKNEFIRTNRFELLADNVDNKEEEEEEEEEEQEKEVAVESELSNSKGKANKNKKNNKTRSYLNENRIFSWFKEEPTTKDIIKGRGNQSCIMASAPIYDVWIRTFYEKQVWEHYSGIAKNQKFWAKEAIRRTKKRDDVENNRFIQKKINQLSSQIDQQNALISDLQINLGNYWTYVPNKRSKRLEQAIIHNNNENDNPNAAPSTTTTTAASSSVAHTVHETPESIRDEVNKLEKCIVEYIKHCIKHVKDMTLNRIKLANAEMGEYKALEDFQLIATPAQWNLHLLLKPKMKLWNTKNKNYLVAQKRVEYELPPKFISKFDFNFKTDNSITSPDEAQTMNDEIRKINKDFRLRTMTLYKETLAREHELLLNEINQIIKGFPEQDSSSQDQESCVAAFMHYHELKLKRMNFEAQQSIHFLEEQRAEDEDEEIIVAPAQVRILDPSLVLQI